MEHFKQFEFFIDDLTDEAKARFIKFLGGDDGNHDVIPLHVYQTICEDGDCKNCEWKCSKDGEEDFDD